MPPKKKARLGPDLLSSLPPQLAQQLEPSELTTAHLLSAYGLDGPLDDDDEADPLRLCAPKWLEDQPAPSDLTPPPEVIVLGDSEDDNTEEVKPKQRGKGKGREKATVCSVDNCAKNPRCLNWLGQDKWEDTEKAFKAYKKAASLGRDPNNERDGDLPVGLRNLGATCYANSFLQVWFQDVTFRSGVYACLPPASGDVESSPLFQLQVLFAFLQTANQAVYDPEPLVTSLKLDKTEQQDSQEFSKLFMTLLDSEFKKHGARAASEGLGGIDVAKLVSTQFEGEKTFGTECGSCKTLSERTETFLELEINLSRDCFLEKRIAQALQEESLEGDNQYFCGNCNKLRDATRFVRLNTLPPVLHFSLLRFVFNMKDFTRSKSNLAISYPLKLDMGEFLPADDFGVHPEVWYDLKGVLMHKGTSAHHGHYVAQVHDASKNKWYLFDDEAVTSIEDLNAPDRYDEEEATAAKKKTAKKNNNFPRNAAGEILPRSKDAYMLIYTRRDDPAPAGATEPAPPPLALARVEELDAKHVSELAEYEKKVAAVKSQFDDVRDAKRAVYRNWNVLEEDKDVFIVHKASLREWLEDGLKPLKADSSPSDDKPAIPANGDSALEGDSIVTPQPESQAGSESESLDVVPETPHIDGEDAGAEPLKAAESDMAVDSSDPSITPTAVGDGGSPDIVEESGNSQNVISNESLKCAHGMVNPNKAATFKVISQIGVMALRDQGVKLEPEFIARRDLCRECVWGMIAERLYNETHPEQVNTFKNERTTGPQAVFISKRWITDWQKAKPLLHKPNTLADPHPGADDWAGDVFCVHGGLQPDSAKRASLSSAAAAVLEGIFPEWQTLECSEKPCSKCQKSYDIDADSASEVQQQLKNEKVVFQPSFNSQGHLGANSLFYPDGEDHYLIPRAWAMSWIRWSKKYKDQPRPERLKNEDLLCAHNKLLLDLEAEMDKPTIAHAVTRKEWDLLRTNYKADPPISIWMNGDTPETSPGVCTGCMSDRRKNFSEAKIMVKVLSADEFDATGARKAAREPSSDLEIIESPTDKKRAANPTTYSTRQSKRIKAQPMIKIKKASKLIEMRKDDTVKDLKVRINDVLDIPTIYQRLWYNNRELESSDTVEELGLYNGATIEVLEVSVDDDIDLGKLDDAVPDADRKRKNRGEGFGGTGLTGWDSPRAGPDGDASGSGDGDAMDVDQTPVASGSGAKSASPTSGSGGGGRPRRAAKADAGAKPAQALKGAKPVSKESGNTRSCHSCTYEQEGDGDDCVFAQLSSKDAICAKCGRRAKDQLNLRLSVCGRCQESWYCSRDCQVADFPTHKSACKRNYRKRIDPPQAPVDVASSGPGASLSHLGIKDLLTAFECFLRERDDHILFVVSQRYFECVERSVLPVIGIRVRFTIEDEKFLFLNAETTTFEEYAAELTESFRDEKESLKEQRRHALEFADSMRTTKDIYEQEFESRRIHWTAVNGDESQACAFRLFATVEVHGRIISCDVKTLRSIWFSRSSVDPANVSLDFDDPLRRYLAAPTLPKTNLAQAEATFDAYSEDSSFVSRATATPTGRFEADLDGIKEELSQYAARRGVPFDLSRALGISYVLRDYSLGPPTDERLEWIGKKVTSEETELRVRQHELARMTQGGGLSQLAAQLTSSEYGSAETLGSKLEQLEPGD